MSLTDQMAGVKRSYHRMMDQASECGISMDGVAYQDFTHPGFYTPPPPPPQVVLFSNPFPSPHGEYEGYVSTAEPMYHFSAARSNSEPFLQNNSDSFISHSSASSSCDASLAGPATPPPPPARNGPTMMKYPAVPITPSHAVPRQKAKRTATVGSLAYFLSWQRGLTHNRHARSAASASRNATARLHVNRARSKSWTASIARYRPRSKSSYLSTSAYAFPCSQTHTDTLTQERQLAREAHQPCGDMPEVDGGTELTPRHNGIDFTSDREAFVAMLPMRIGSRTRDRRLSSMQSRQHNCLQTLNSSIGKSPQPAKREQSLTLAFLRIAFRSFCLTRLYKMETTIGIYWTCRRC